METNENVEPVIEDPLGAAKGMARGCLFSLPFWIAVIVVVVKAVLK